MDVRRTAISILILLALLLFLSNILHASGQIIHPIQNRTTYYIPFSFYITGSAIGDFVLTYLTGITLMLLADTPKKTIIIYSSTVLFLLFASANESIIAYVATGLAASPLMILFMQYKLKGLPTFSFSNFITVFIISWLFVEVSAFLLFAMFTVNPGVLGTILLTPYEWLFSGFSIINPVLAAVLFFSFLIRNFRSIRPWHLHSYHFLDRSFFSKQTSLLILLASILFIFFLMQIPYSITLNPNQKYISTDEHDYLQRLEKLDRTGSSLIAKEIFVANGERPLFILLLYSLKILFPFLSNLEVLRLVPYLIWAGFVASVYFVTLKLTGNRDVAVLSAAFSSLSSQPLVMIYGGFFANFVALSVAYPIFLCLSRIWKNGLGVITIVYAVALLTILLFTHVYTWTWMIGVLIIFGIVSVVAERKTQDRRLLLRKVVAITVIILSSVLIDYTKVTTLGSVGGLERDIAIAGESISYQQFFSRWNNLAYAFSTYLGGFIISIVFLLFTVYWSIKFKHDTILDRIILSTIYLLSFIFLFGDFVLQTRLFLNIPIGIIIGLVIYSKILQSKNLSRRNAVLMVVAVVIFSVHYLYASFSNLVFPL